MKRYSFLINSVKREALSEIDQQALRRAKLFSLFGIILAIAGTTGEVMSRHEYLWSLNRIVFLIFVLAGTVLIFLSSRTFRELSGKYLRHFSLID